MAATTIFDVVDYLVATITAACPPPTVVYDGFPGLNRPDVLVSVGGSVDPTIDNAETWASLGAKSKDENYTVNCYVSAYVGGGEPTDQKVARDAAKTAFNAIELAIRADTTLGGHVLVGGIDGVRLEQTDDTTASDGRIAEIHFVVRCMARI